MSIGKGTHRVVTLDLLGAVAGALSRDGKCPNVLTKVREQIAADWPAEVCSFDELCDAGGATGFGPDRLTEYRNIEAAVLNKLRSNAKLTGSGTESG